MIVVAAVEIAVELALNDGLETSPWLAAPAGALLALPLLARRRFPFAAPAFLWLAAAALSFVDGDLVTLAALSTVAGMAAAFLLGGLRDRVQARVGLALAVAGAATVVYNDPGHSGGDYVFVPVLFAIAWLAGFAMRQRSFEAEAAEERAARAEREREAAARLAVAEERTRIARELHDIVAHAVSVRVLQVGAVRHKLPEGDDKQALAGVEHAGRTALSEMRRLLGAMRQDGEEPEFAPQPGLADLDGLVEQVGRAGLPVELHVDGEAFPLPRALDLSAYRIVQEGLTNALKHAGAAHADVRLRYRPDELRIEVRDDGSGAEPADDGPGHGLVGIRERVKIYGGEISAGAAPDGGFVLETRLPVRGDAR